MIFSLAIIFTRPLWFAAPKNLREETVLCSSRALNLIELIFVVLQEPQMHGVVARYKALCNI